MWNPAGSLVPPLLALGLSLLAMPPLARAAELLSADEIELKVVLQERADRMVRQLRDWVEMNTGSYNRAGLERFSHELSRELEDLGFDVDRLSGDSIELPDRGTLRTP